MAKRCTNKMHTKPRKSKQRPLRSDSGMVIAETAVALPAFLLLLLAGLFVVSAVVAGMRCGDAAREGARSLARGETAETARQVMEQNAPRGAHTEVQRADGAVTVTVSSVVKPWGGWLNKLPGLTVTSKVVASEE